MHPTPLVHTTRGYLPDSRFIENVHYGSVAVVDLAGNLVHGAGDPHQPIFTRSTIKPFQALPFLLDDGPATLGLTEEELALMCASHSGEERHVAGAASLLAKAGFGEQHLRCGCHVPMHYEVMGRTPPADARWNQLHHNCSGKHSGFLAYCRLHGHAPDDYIAPAHPLQQRIRSILAALAGLQESDLPMGLDGCSAPNYALPLSRLAHLFARLAQGRRDPQYGAAMGDLFDAMTRHPGMVSGENRSDVFYMEAGGGDWVAKVGADGVQLIGIRSLGIGIAVKIVDGNNKAAQTAAVSALRQLGLLDSRGEELIRRYAVQPILNAAGRHAGDIEAVFSLRKY